MTCIVFSCWDKWFIAQDEAISIYPFEGFPCSWCGLVDAIIPVGVMGVPVSGYDSRGVWVEVYPGKTINCIYVSVLTWLFLIVYINDSHGTVVVTSSLDL